MFLDKVEKISPPVVRQADPVQLVPSAEQSLSKDEDTGSDKTSSQDQLGPCWGPDGEDSWGDQTIQGDWGAYDRLLGGPTLYIW